MLSRLPKLTVRMIVPIVNALLASGMFAAPGWPPVPPGVANVGIFYEGPDLPLAEGYLGAHYIENLLGHFGLRGEMIRMADYRPGQAARYRAAFYIGSVPSVSLPQAFLKDVMSSSQPFCWLGLHIEQLLASPEGRRFGFRYLGRQGNRAGWRIEYKDTLFPRDDLNLNFVEPVEGRQVEIQATAVRNDNKRLPYALRQNRFWYFADAPLEGREASRYLIFCDLLHDILEIDHRPQPQALVRLEDISAEAEPADLRAAADVLGRRHIPFQMAVIPLYRNPGDNVEMRLSDRPKVVEAIHYMIDRGGTPVMHGWSHQYHTATGDDYEFWDGIKNSAIAGDSEHEMRNRIDSGMAELFANNIFPVAFETPHYAASPVDYHAMEQEFSLFYERTMPTPHLSSIQYFPYPVIDEFGRQVVPENLGYLPEEKPDPKVVIENARYMRVVRDGIASFYFHPFLDAKLLDDALRGISALGYRFVSLRQFGGNVNDQGRYVVRTEPGSVQLFPHDEFWRLRRFDAGGKLLSEQTAPGPTRNPVAVNIDVPAGGWVALDCFKPPDHLAQAKALLQVWWSRMTARRHGQAATADYDEPRDAWILWIAKPSGAESNNQQSYRTVLDLCGFSTRPVAVEKFKQMPGDKTTLLVVPGGVATLVTKDQQRQILRYLSSGGMVLADGHQEWLQMLGFHMTGWRLPVAEMQEVLVEGASFSWKPEEPAERYLPPPGSQPLARESESKQPLAVTGGFGAGRYLYLSVPLDNHTPNGVSHFPYLDEYLATAFHMRSALRGGRIEAYVDPGYRGGIDLDSLAKFWQRSGIRTVYVAAWHFYDRYSFDYRALIHACHRRGISVYAWFMFPQVTQVMWQQHPEWREQAASGGDGRPGWRYLLNFQNPICFRAAMDWAKDLLQSQSWDGINIAELNFDAAHPNYLQPSQFVPMNDIVRREFRDRAGFDPAELFVPNSLYYYERNHKALAAFLRYREDVVTEWHRRVLTELAPIARGRGLEMIVTVMDSLHSSYVQPALGVNSHRIAALMKDFDFTLQVEDPVEHWAEPADRYVRFHEAYRRLVPDERRVMFDINVVSDRDVEATTLPSTIALGTELAQTVKAAAVLGRVAIYAEHTVDAEDWPLIGSALAHPARIEEHAGAYRMTTPFPLFLDVFKGRRLSVDGRAWPVDPSNGVPIPSGEHQVALNTGLLRLFSSSANLLRGNSGDLIEAQERSTGLWLRYSSPGQAAIVVNREPLVVSIDGRKANLTAEGHGDEWVLLAPKGQHSLEVTTLSSTGLAVNWWSQVWSWLVTILGGGVTLLMLWFYFRLRLGSTNLRRQSAR